MGSKIINGSGFNKYDNWVDFFPLVSIVCFGHRRVCYVRQVLEASTPRGGWNVNSLRAVATYARRRYICIFVRKSLQTE